MWKTSWAFLITIAFILLSPLNSLGDVTTNDSVPGRETPQKFEVELEDLTSLVDERKIETLSLNVLKETSDNSHFSFYHGLTFTRSWGDIIQHQEKLKSSAFGIGPVCLLRDNIFQGLRSSFTLDMSMGLIFYNECFPANGTTYNFMWRMGPKFRYQINDNLLLSCGYKWMHISNGQLVSDHNPSYNASGFSLSLTTKF